MAAIQVLSMLAALAVTLGLFGLAVWAFRRYAPVRATPPAEGADPVGAPLTVRNLATNVTTVTTTIDAVGPRRWRTGPARAGG